MSRKPVVRYAPMIDAASDGKGICERKGGRLFEGIGEALEVINLPGRAYDAGANLKIGQGTSRGLQLIDAFFPVEKLTFRVRDLVELGLPYENLLRHLIRRLASVAPLAPHYAFTIFRG